MPPLRDIICSEQLNKLKKIKPFGHSKASIFSKKGQLLLIFPVLQKLTHMCAEKIGSSLDAIITDYEDIIARNEANLWQIWNRVKNSICGRYRGG